MKKLITTLLILFLSLGLFAETGYTGTEWGTPKTWFKFEEQLEDIGIKNKIILGEDTKIFYSFYKNKLEGVSYSIPTKKIKQLLKNYQGKKQYGKIKIEELTREDVCTELEPEYQNEKGIELYLHNFCENTSIWCDVAIAQNYKGEGKCTVYIYNYNEDTRVYIFENLMEGKTFVYYTFREQDY